MVHARMRLTRAAAFAVAVATIWSVPRPLCAQDARRVDPSAAELAIALGRLDVAEEALYDAVARAPREPSARGALGAFLAARGKFLAGATLLDEALFFGADTVVVQARQLNVYRWTGEYGRVATLASVRLPAEAREAYRRAGVGAAGGAPFATVALAPNEASGLGRITIAIGAASVPADIQPLAEGLELPSSLELFRAIEVTGARGDTTWGVARALRFGDVTYGPVPVTLVPGLSAARLGLDVLSRLVPTFNDRARALTVRSTALPPPGDTLPVLLGFPGVRFVTAARSAPLALHDVAGRAALRGRAWTLDVAAGAIVVAR
jgi:hypothetical protein